MNNWFQLHFATIRYVLLEILLATHFADIFGFNCDFLLSIREFEFQYVVQIVSIFT